MTHPAGRRPWDTPRTRWRDFIFTLAGERLGISQSDLAEVAGKRGVWGYPRGPTLDKLLKIDGWIS